MTSRVEEALSSIETIKSTMNKVSKHDLQKELTIIKKWLLSLFCVSFIFFLFEMMRVKFFPYFLPTYFRIGYAVVRFGFELLTVLYYFYQVHSYKGNKERLYSFSIIPIGFIFMYVLRGVSAYFNLDFFLELFKYPIEFFIYPMGLLIYEKAFESINTKWKVYTIIVIIVTLLFLIVLITLPQTEKFSISNIGILLRDRNIYLLCIYLLPITVLSRE